MPRVTPARSRSRRRRHGLVAAVLLAVAVAAVPAAAPALPGDEPSVPLTPADGAVVPVDPDGIGVTFTCPVYRVSSAGEGFSVFGGPPQHGVSFSRSPALGPDGRLADPVSLDPGRAGSTEGTCEGTLGAGGAAPRPQETPGTYFWQVWRLCTGCEGSYETGPVRRVVLRATVVPAVGAFGAAYATYPVLVPVTATGAADGTAITVERRAGRRWVRAGGATVLGGRGEAVVTPAAAGALTLRAVVRLGDETLTSTPRAVIVRPASARRTTTRRDDGRYRGTGTGIRSITLRATGGGRELRDLAAYVPMTCPGLQPGQFTTQIGTARLIRVRVAPDGRFVAASAPASATAIRVRGRLQGRRITGGRVELSVGDCLGNAAFTARRTGR